MGKVKSQTRHGPEPENLPFRGGIALIEPEDPDRAKVQSIQHARSGGKVIRLLGEIEISGVEDHAKDPARDAEVAKGQVESTKWVVGRNTGSDLGHAMLFWRIPTTTFAAML